MAQVTLPYSLTAGSPENVNNLVANLNALRDGVNTIDTAQIASSAVTSAKIAANAVTYAKVAGTNSEFTPTLSFGTGGGNTGLTYSSRWGREFRIADQVRVVGEIILANKGSSTGVVVIGGLPYTVKDAGYYQPCQIFVEAGGSSLPASITGYFDSGQKRILVVKQGAGTAENVTEANVTNTLRIWFNGWYSTSDA